MKKRLKGVSELPVPSEGEATPAEDAVDSTTTAGAALLQSPSKDTEAEGVVADGKHALD